MLEPPTIFLPDSPLPWAVCQTHSNCEKQIARAAFALDVPYYLPLTPNQTPLLPGFLFIKASESCFPPEKLRGPQVSKWVFGYLRTRLQHKLAKEILLLQQQALLSQTITIGQQVQVVAPHPLQGLTGVTTIANGAIAGNSAGNSTNTSTRFFVVLHLLGRQVSIEIDRRFLAPATSRQQPPANAKANSKEFSTCP